jgi:hypothetical protein
MSKLDLLIQSIFDILGDLSLIDDKKASYEKFIFSFHKLFNNVEKIGSSEYHKVMKKNITFISSLGLFKKENNQETNEEEEEEIKIQPINKSLDTIVFGCENWNLSLGLMLGIQISFNFFTPLVRDLKHTDFTVTCQYDLPLMINEATVSFTTFNPTVFKKIRELFQISDSDFFGSIGVHQIFGNLLSGKLSSFSQNQSAGKSGSHFFVSHDSKFLIKTISKSEAANLRKILPSYYTVTNEIELK